MATFGPYPARVEEVQDGDSIILDIDLGFAHLISGKDLDGKTRLSCRVWNFNSPEKYTPEGKLAKDFAHSILPVGARVLVLSHGWDKYGGRFNGTITLPDGRDFAQVMIDADHGSRP